jgi:putative ABC transport system permease protein
MTNFGKRVDAKGGERARLVPLWLELLLQDGRYALRTLRSSPGLSAVVVLTLALGISMNTAIFSVFNAVILRPVAYPTPERLLWLSTVQNDEPGFVLGPDFVDWREQATSFDRMFAYGAWDQVVATDGGSTRARLVDVTSDFWDLTAARLAAGRLPRPEEREVVVVSTGFAQRWFPGDADVVGRTLTIQERQATVVGVLHEDFRFHLPASPWPGFRAKEIDIYQPLFISPVREGMIGLYNVVGRVRQGVSIDHARAELEGIWNRITQEHPNPYWQDNQRRLRVVPLHDQLSGAARLALWVLLAAVAFVLLIACANVANLLLARASTRQKEIAIRISLGAGRARVLRQCLMESFMLALIGSALGLLVGRLAITAILRLDPHAVPRLAESNIDSSVLAVTLGLSVLTAVVFGLAPALALWKVNPNEGLREDGRASPPHGAGIWIRGSLLAAQLSLAVVLLIGAGLMLKSAWRLTAHPAGFEPAQILTTKVEFSGKQYEESPARQVALREALLEGMRTQPGVEAVSISTHGYNSTPHLVVEGEPVTSPDDRPLREPILINATSSALSRVMGLRVNRGRWLADNEPAAVINERLSAREFPGKDPIGRRIRLDENGPFLTIVGVVEDLRYTKLDAVPEPEVYVPYSQVDGMFGFIFLVRTASDPLDLVPALRSLMARIDPSQVLDEVTTLEQALADSIAPRRLNLLLLGSFAASALALAVIGIYGLLTHWVTYRRQELGIRMALGAQRQEVVQMVVRKGMGIALTGIGAGVVGALALTRVVSSLLYDVEPRDPVTFIVITAGLATTAFLACCLPALRAARVDPVVALRYE